MTVRHIIEQLGLRVWAQGRDQEVREGYVSDLLSDAIAHADEGSLWITVQRHINVVAVAQLKKIAGIIISRGLEPEAGLRTGPSRRASSCSAVPRAPLLSPESSSRSCAPRADRPDPEAAWRPNRCTFPITPSTGN